MRIKNGFLISSVIVLSTLFFTSCKKDAVTPDVSISASKTRAAVNEVIEFTVTGYADGFAVYTGDADHQFEYSKYVLTKDKDIEKEIVFLTQTGYDGLAASGLLTDSVLNLVRGLINIKYEGLSHPIELIFEFSNYELQFSPSLPLIQSYFTIEHFVGAPPSGYSKGVALDPEESPRIYRYSYTSPGTYTVNLVATNIGHKKYSPNGYSYNRITDESEYDRNTVIKSIIITVE